MSKRISWNNPFDVIVIVGFTFVLGVGLLVVGGEYLSTDLNIQNVEHLRRDVERAGCPTPGGLATKVVEMNETILFKQSRCKMWVPGFSAKWDDLPLIDLPICNQK